MSRDPLDYWSPPTWEPGLDHPRYAVVPGGGLKQWSGPWVGDEEANYYWNVASAHRRAEWLAKNTDKEVVLYEISFYHEGRPRGVPVWLPQQTFLRH